MSKEPEEEEKIEEQEPELVQDSLAEPNLKSENEEDDILGPLKEYAKPVIIGAVVAIAIFGGIAGINSYKKSGLDRSSFLLATADTQDKLQQISIQYPDTSASVIAQLSMASTHYHQGQYDLAMKIYTEIKDGNNHKQYNVTAELGLAFCQSAQLIGKFNGPRRNLNGRRWIFS